MCELISPGGVPLGWGPVSSHGSLGIVIAKYSLFSWKGGSLTHRGSVTGQGAAIICIVRFAAVGRDSGCAALECDGGVDELMGGSHGGIDGGEQICLSV